MSEPTQRLDEAQHNHNVVGHTIALACVCATPGLVERYDATRAELFAAQRAALTGSEDAA